MDGSMDRADGWTDGRTDGWIGQKDGRTDTTDG
jgi:hypothetical protein